MAESECLTSSVKEIGKCLISPAKEIGRQYVWPPIKSEFDFWWRFDSNIQDLRDEIEKLKRKRHSIEQEIEGARLGIKVVGPGVEEWLKASTDKLEEAPKILQADKIPSWNLISRYLVGKNAKKTAEKLKKHQNDGNFNPIAYPAPPPAMGFPFHRSTMDFESRKPIEEDIINSLKESSVDIIGICGIEGVGKTTMAQRIWKKVKDENIADEVVMVTVGQKIDMPKIQEEIAELLGLKFDVNTFSVRAHKLRTRLMDTKRKIIIFDDVWERLKLEDLGVSRFERCKILFTTRSKDVCKKMEAQKMIQIEILTEDEAWILFKKKAGDCSTLASVAKDVAAE